MHKFERIAFCLPAGEISPVFRTVFGSDLWAEKKGGDTLYGGVIDIDDDARVEYWTRAFGAHVFAAGYGERYAESSP